VQIKKILITGAAGYLAGFIIDRLHLKYKLTLIDLVKPPPDFENLPFVKGDITSYHDVEKACVGQDAVVHLVALVRQRFDKPLGLFADIMVKGTWNVAEACAKQGVQRLVNISSISACNPLPDSKLPYCVGDPFQFKQGDLYYALAKYLGEQIGNAYYQAHGLSTIHLRPGVIAGDGLNPGPEAPTGADQPWFIYVDPRDIAQAVELAIETQDIDCGCFNIVSGRQDASYDWIQSRQQLGYNPEHNWLEIPESGTKS
jgi:nucleoside-diphosphate-sugar epimerase